MPAKLTFVGHATVAVELDGAGSSPTPSCEPGSGRFAGTARRFELPALGSLDAVLISHLHRDHADLPSLRRLGDVPMLVPPGAGRFFERQGFRSVSELAVGQSAQVGAVTVTAIEAVHDGGGGAPATRRRSATCSPAGSGSTSPETPTSSTAWAPCGEVDLALLPIWGWGPSLGPGHMDPERAARAAALIEPRIVVPIHWGTLYPEVPASPAPRAAERSTTRVREVDGGAGASGGGAGAGPGRVHLGRVGGVPERAEPAAKYPVDSFGADHLFLGPVEIGGVQDEGE